MTDTVTKTLPSIYLEHVEKFAARINKFGANVTVFDSANNCAADFNAERFDSDIRQLAEFARMARQTQASDVQKFGHSYPVLTLLITHGELKDAVVVVDPGDTTLTGIDEIKDVSKKCNLDAHGLECAVKNLTHDIDYLAEILTLFANEFKYATQASQQLEMVSTELAQTYEELILLYNLSTNAIRILSLSHISWRRVIPTYRMISITSGTNPMIKS